MHSVIPSFDLQCLGMLSVCTRAWGFGNQRISLSLNFKPCWKIDQQTKSTEFSEWQRMLSDTVSIEEAPLSPHGMITKQFLEQEHLIDVLKIIFTVTLKFDCKKGAFFLQKVWKIYQCRRRKIKSLVNAWIKDKHFYVFPFFFFHIYVVALSLCWAQQQPHNMWDLSGPEFKSTSPSLAGRFSTTGPPGKSWVVVI